MKEMSPSDLVIREYRDSDLPGVLDLWEHHSGWGRPDQEEYKKWLKTPYGDCIGIVAEYPEHNIIGHFISTPTEVYVEGIKGKALKNSAPVIHRDYRSAAMLAKDSMILQLLIQGYHLLEEKGFDWLYSFPAHAWIRLIESFHRFGPRPWRTMTLPCYETEDAAADYQGYELQSLDHFPASFGQVWELFRNNHPQGSYFTRDPVWLNYKWGDEIKIEICSRSWSLAGYAVIKRTTGLILDLMLPEHDDIPAILKALVRYYRDLTPNESNSSKPGLKFMGTSFFQDYLKELRVRPVDYQFAFGISHLKDENMLKEMKMDNWYIFPND